MHLGDILDIVNEHTDGVSLADAMTLAQQVMELHSIKVSETKDAAYSEGYDSGHQVGKSRLPEDDYEFERLRRLESYMVTVANEKVPEIVARIGSDRKIQCIKELRNVTGLGLKQTKDIVDAHIASLGYYNDRSPF